jgi:hypothetical protein
MANVTATGTLIGNVEVTPTVVKPGESVLIQVLDPNGRPYSETSDVAVTIQGVQSAARYYQFATPGTRSFVVRATKGAASDTKTVSVQVTGDAVTFRRTLGTPATTALPIIQLEQSLGSPYQATFTLGTPMGALLLMAQQHPVLKPATPANKSELAALDVKAVAPAPLESEIAKTVAALPVSSITTIAPKTTITKSGVTVIGSGQFGPKTGTTQTTPAATGYKWDFGDGTTATTQSPTVTHDYFPAIKAGLIAHSFNVRCTVQQDNVTATRTLVLYSAYGLCKQFGKAGTIVPYVTGDVFAKFQQVAFSAALVLHNIEPQAITLDHMAFIPLESDPNAAPLVPKFTQMKTPITIKANSSVGLGVYVPVAQLRTMAKLGPSTTGIMVYYSGTSADGKTPVRFSRALRISINDSGMAASISLVNKAWDLGGALKAIEGVASPISAAGTQTADAATNTVAIPLTANAHDPATLAKLQSSVRAGLTNIATNVGALNLKGAPIKTVPVVHTFDGPPAPGPVQEGQVCDPDNISDADAATANSLQLVCQSTGVTQTVEMPSAFQNALMGDAILSPGGDGGDQIIASLLRALNPPQYHSHSGIMSQNFTEITHCTAAAQRMGDYTVGIGGAGGIQPNVLQYAWPGSITQNIDAATNGENWNDPSGKTYNIGGFTPDALGITTNDHFIIVPPLVVKPLPENEETARPLLRNAAATARSKGGKVDSNGNVQHYGGCYYCFYGYTKPEIAAGFADAAGADAGWAQGLSPAVCSSFVWLNMKENHVNCVSTHQYTTPSDLAPTSVAAGAAVGPGTLDGLFYYSQDERQAAAAVLNSIFANQILDKEGFFQYIPFLGSDIAQNIADQIMNMFAFNNPNMYGSNQWLTSGAANAVSPDNISWWNAPMFGYAEPLQYLQSHTEQYTVSKWKKVITRGTIQGKVTLNGAAVNGAHVWVYDGKDAYADGSGNYKLENVPIGNYTIQAQGVVSGMEYSVSQAIDLTGESLTVNLALHGLPDEYRTLEVLYSVSCDHGDCNLFNTHGVQNAGPDLQSANVSPGHITNGIHYNYNYNNGGYFNIDYDFHLVLAEDLSVDVTLTATMNYDGGGEEGQQTVTFNVPKDGQYFFEIDIQCSGTCYHNGPAKLTGTATNKETTG